jgi:hypothetical protein
MKNAKKVLLIGVSSLLILTPSWFATASTTKSSLETTPKYSDEYYNQRANDFNRSIDSMKCVKEDSAAEANSRRSTGIFAYTGNTYVLSNKNDLMDTTSHDELGIEALLESVQVPNDFYQLNTEIACFAKTIRAEQGNQPIPDLWAVGQVIMNRLHDTEFYGKRNYKNLFDVLFDYKQFSANPYYIAPGQQKKPGRNWKLEDTERDRLIYKIAVLCYLGKIPEKYKIDERTLAFFMPHQCSASFVNSFSAKQVTHRSPNGTVYCRLSRD